MFHELGHCELRRGHTNGKFSIDESWQSIMKGDPFAGIEGRAIARDMFLDGNLWRDGPRVEDRRDYTGDLQVGVALHQGDVQVAFTYVHRTEEFVAQSGPQRFGAVSISIAR